MRRIGLRGPRTRFHEPPYIRHAVPAIPLLLTNDDGVQSPGLIGLARFLHARGHPLLVMAPKSEQSASAMKLTLRDGMVFQEHTDIASEITIDERTPLRVFSLDGSPCDCVIVAIDGGLEKLAPGISPALCVSGINRGPNLSVDVLHSGTVSAAREASLYGMPSLAVSLATTRHQNYSESFSATGTVIDSISPFLSAIPPDLGRPEGVKPVPEGLSKESLRQWFQQGNIFLNLNVPGDWGGGFRTVQLGARWYRNASTLIPSEDRGVTFEIGAASIHDEDIPGTDCAAIGNGFASLTPLGSWPSNHPLGAPCEIIEAATEQGEDGLPSWL